MALEYAHFEPPNPEERAKIETDLALEPIILNPDADLDSPRLQLEPDPVREAFRLKLQAEAISSGRVRSELGADSRLTKFLGSFVGRIKSMNDNRQARKMNRHADKIMRSTYRNIISEAHGLLDEVDENDSE